MHIDALIAELAGRQLHVVTREQLKSIGATRHQISHRIAIGSLRPQHPGVFLTVADPPSFEQRSLAACLACGDDAFVSHTAAAVILNLLESCTRIDVTVPSAQRPRLHGVEVHRSTSTGPGERMRRGVLWVARPMRTLLDLAALVGDEALEAATDRAVFSGLVSPPRFSAYLERPELLRRPGSGRLRRIVRDRVANGHGESVLETKMFRLLRRFNLPQPQRQFTTTIDGRVLRFDLAYPADLVAIELDGEGPHRERWQSDHDRHNVTERSRWLVLRFTWRDVTQRPHHVAWTIAEVLGIRPARWIPDINRPGRPA